MGRLPAVMDLLPDRDADEEARARAVAGLAGLRGLEQGLGYVFSRPALLRAALTLGSWVNEHQGAGWPSNACLEFYGDAVLGVVAADALWGVFPERAEGELTRLRSSLVSEAGLAGVGRELDLGRWLFLGRGDEQRGARDHAGTLADAVEAVFGAVFLDARERGHDPFAVALSLFERLFGDRVAELDPDHDLDPKSRLQQWVQSKYRVTPVYAAMGEAPPAEDPRWRVRVELRKSGGAVEVLGEGEGRSLREAEQGAARAALRAIEAEDPNSPA